MSRRPETFGGLQKGFLVSGAMKTTVRHKEKTKITPTDTEKTHPASEIDGEQETGDLEFQLLREGDLEEEGSLAWKKCSKYPGHEGFIPLPDLSLQDLPERFQDEDTLNFIKVFGDLTVRLCIKISSNRPGDDPFAKHAGLTITGTAYVGEVHLLSEGCFCEECKINKYRNRKWWRITLASATHCVNDDKETENVRIDFFYDNEESLKCGKVKTLRGVAMLTALRTEDQCVMECATHDDDLGRYLTKKCEQLAQLEITLRSKSESRSAGSHDKLMICISHPHGMPKRVTVGEFRRQYYGTYKNDYASLASVIMGGAMGSYNKLVDYTTRTCPGSSGAAVLCLDDFTSGEDLKSKHLSTLCTHLKGKQSTGLNTGYCVGINSLEHSQDIVRLMGFTSLEDAREKMRDNTWFGSTWTD